MKHARRLSLLLWRTKSSAIAERGRAMPIVSFNSTMPRVQSFIICYFGFRFTTAFNYILFCCLRCNVEVSCHKQDSPISGAASSVSRNQQIPPLNVLTYTTPPSNCWRYATVQQWSMPKPYYWSKIAIFAPVNVTMFNFRKLTFQRSEA